MTIKTFNYEEDFITFIDILKNRQIAYQTEIFNSTIDPASLRTVEKEFLVKVRQMDFPLVNQIIDEIAEEAVQEVESNHYLFSFSNSELYEIIAKPDEWSAFDYQLSKKILKERGKSIDDDFLRSLKKARMEDLSKQEESQSGWIIFGYVSAILGGLLGIAIGWYLKSQQKTLPNGQKIYQFKDSDRKHGTRIFYIGIIMLIIIVVVQLLEKSFFNINGMPE